MANRSSFLRQEAAQRAAAVGQDAYEDYDYNYSPNNYRYMASTPFSSQQQQQQQQQNSMTLSPQHALDYSPTEGQPLAPPPQPAISGGLAASARKEWKQHGAGVTQVLEETRNASNRNLPGQLTVRVISAQKRVDLVGSNYTAYIVKVTQHQREVTVEHRYSDFAKLNAVLRQYSSSAQTAASSSSSYASISFPSKHWAGRVGNWTPSLTWAPAKHSDLVAYRVVQLDMWLVHVVHQYNQGALLVRSETAAAAVYDFLAGPDKPPCDQVNELVAKEQWKWNNPFSFTLGSTIRQATHTINYMCHNVLTAKEQSIPLDLLHAATGLCFLTVCKAGLVVSGCAGTGLVIARRGDGTWSAPCALGTVGVGWGALVGGAVTHYLVVLTTEQAVKDLVASSSVQLGAELGVAVGPIGRNANSHVSTGDYTLHPAYAYAHSQGLFVGMSLEGSVVAVRNDVNAKFYGRACEPAADLLRQSGPKAAEPLYNALQKALQMEIPEDSFRPSHLWSPQANTVPTPRTSIPVGTNNGYGNGRPVTIDTMHQGPSAIFDQVTPSTVMHANGAN